MLLNNSTEIQLMHLRQACVRNKPQASPRTWLQANLLWKKPGSRDIQDTQTGMLQGIPRSARCVQRFDDSLNSAIHITYRISLRSSSMGEPRDPLSKVIFCFLFFYVQNFIVCKVCHWASSATVHRCLGYECRGVLESNAPFLQFNNDPSAGSPTETLLWLLLPLNDQVCISFQQLGAIAGSQTPIPKAH